MLRIKEREYSGQVFEGANETLTVVIYSTDLFQDVTEYIADAEEITVTSDGDVRTYMVSSPIAAKVISNCVYSMEYSTKVPFEQEMKDKLEEQSTAIDMLLVALLEE